MTRDRINVFFKFSEASKSKKEMTAVNTTRILISNPQNQTCNFCHTPHIYECTGHYSCHFTRVSSGTYNEVERKMFCRKNDRNKHEIFEK